MDDLVSNMKTSAIENPGSYAFTNATIGRAITALEAQVERLTADKAGLVDEVMDLKQNVIAFCGPWAAQYARDHGFPAGHLHPVHYDILEKCGARMDDFTRAALKQHGENHD